MTIEEARAYLKCTTYELFCAAYVAKNGWLQRWAVDSAYAIHNKNGQVPYWVDEYIEKLPVRKNEPALN